MYADRGSKSLLLWSVSVHHGIGQVSGGTGLLVRSGCWRPGDPAKRCGVCIAARLARSSSQQRRSAECRVCAGPADPDNPAGLCGADNSITGWAGGRRRPVCPGRVRSHDQPDLPRLDDDGAPTGVIDTHLIAQDGTLLAVALAAAAGDPDQCVELVAEMRGHARPGGVQLRLRRVTRPHHGAHHGGRPGRDRRPLPDCPSRQRRTRTRPERGTTMTGIEETPRMRKRGGTQQPGPRWASCRPSRSGPPRSGYASPGSPMSRSPPTPPGRPRSRLWKPAGWPSWPSQPRSWSLWSAPGWTPCRRRRGRCSTRRRQPAIGAGVEGDRSGVADHGTQGPVLGVGCAGERPGLHRQPSADARRGHGSTDPQRQVQQPCAGGGGCHDRRERARRRVHRDPEQ